MAEKLKGITLEIGGNAEPLSNALKDVNKTSANLNKELNQTNKNLKFNPKDTVMLEQKQKLLADSISNTKIKLDTLKEAQSQAKKKFDEGKITEEQFRSLQREISKTENQLGLLEKQYKEVGSSASKSLNAVGDKFKDIGGKTVDVGKKMSVLSAGIVGVGVGAAKSFDEVDEGMDNVIKATGATGAAAEDLEEVYTNLAGSFEGDFESMGSSLGEVNTRFAYTGDKAKECTEQFLRFAKINNTDATESVKSVSRAMQNAGIKTNDYNIVLDQLTLMAQATGTDITKLTDNLTKYGASTRTMGMDTKDTIAMLSAFEKSGVNTEVVMAGMTKASAKWAKEGKNSKDEFNKTVEAIKNSKNPIAASKLAIESFGTKAGAEFADAIKSGRFAYTDYIDMLGKSNGTVETTFNNTRDGMDDVKVATNNLKITGAKFGETIMQNLAPIIQKLSIKLKELTKWFGGLDKGTKDNIIKMAGLVAAIGPALIIIGKLSTGVGSTIRLFSSFFGIIGKVTTAIKGFSLTTAASTIKLIAHKAATLAATVAQKAMAVAQGALNLVMSLNPITLIIIAIVALVATIVILWNKCEWFRNLVGGLFEGLKVGFNAVISFFKMIGGGFVIAFKASIAAIKFVFNAIVEGIKNIWKGACNFIGGAFNLAADGIKAVFTGVRNVVVGIAQGMVNMIIKAVNFCIRTLNKISFNIPDWVPFLGGKHFGVDIKEIREVNWLYKGGIIDKPTIMGSLGVGDAFNGTGRNKEAVVPLDEMYSNIEKMVSKNNASQKIEKIETIIKIDGKEFARATTPYISKQLAQSTR